MSSPYSKENRELDFVATAGQTEFTIPFPFQQADDVVFGTLSDTGDFAPLKANLDFTLTGAGNANGGQITLITPALAGARYRVLGEAVAEFHGRLTGARYSADVINTNFDRVLIWVIEQARDLAGLSTRVNSFISSYLPDIIRNREEAEAAANAASGSADAADNSATLAAGSATAADASKASAAEKAIEAATHAVGALSSKNAAQSAKASAEASQTAAQASAQVATDKASAADVSAAASANSATAAADSQNVAGQKAQEASASATAAANSAASIGNAEANAVQAAAAATASRDKAQDWAETGHNVEVEPGKYSAKHHAEEAARLSQGSASNISVAPVGGIGATTVQAALAELDQEKASAGHNHDDRYYAKSITEALFARLLDSVTFGQYVTARASPTSNAHFLLSDEATGHAVGIVYWERATNIVRVVQYNNGVFGSSIALGDGFFLFDGQTVWHSGNDGAGSSLDADLLDGKHASEFLTASPVLAWATFNASTLQIKAGHNVASITLTSQQTYRVNFINNMPHANYVVVGDVAKENGFNDGNITVRSGGYNNGANDGNTVSSTTLYVGNVTSNTKIAAHHVMVAVIG